MTVVELKARIYDLLAQRQAIDLEIQKINQRIINEESKPKEPDKE
jgi:hypothetical protein